MTALEPDIRQEALALLDWYRAAGVDIALGEEPVDRFAQTANASIARRQSAEPAAPVAPAMAPAAPVSAPLLLDPGEAQAIAAAAPTLKALEAAFAAYDGCPLKARATQLVFADGNPEAKVMLVGEAPGQEEDREGRPFVGRAGRLLDRMLAAIGLDRKSVYIANTVPWRPPGNRNPTVQEIASCRPFLDRQIELVAPQLLVTLGNVPTQTLFATSTGITRMRGQWRDMAFNAHPVKALATFHPAFLLRTPACKELAWRDLLALRKQMDLLGL